VLGRSFAFSWFFCPEDAENQSVDVVLAKEATFKKKLNAPKLKLWQR
jgi:hypothetical protein